MFCGGRGIQDEITVFSLRGYIPKSLLVYHMEVNIDWAEGRGVEDNIRSNIMADGESSIWHLFANSFPLEVPDLWMFS